MKTQVVNEVVQGTVRAVNNRGLVLEGRDGWLNLSRYADPPVQLPERGQTVAVALDRSGYVRGVELVEDTDGSHPPQPEEPCEASSLPARGDAHVVSDRDTRIGRMAALNTAVAILSSGGRAAEARDVLVLARQLERWVTR